MNETHVSISLPALIIHANSPLPVVKRCTVYDLLCITQRSSLDRGEKLIQHRHMLQ